jgi:OOP family OmpA-OmpF porin
MIRNIIGLFICFTSIITQAGAQELGVELNGGLQGMHYQLQNGQTKLLPGGDLGLLYTFRLGTQWGLVTGITGGFYRTQGTLQNGIAFTSGQVDDEGSAFQYNTKAVGYKETQQFFSAGIPLLLQYHTTGEGMQWYADGGGKVLFPSNASIQATAQQLSLSGYYPDFNLPVTNLPEHGFGTVQNWKATTTAKLAPAATLRLATGVSFGLSPGTRLYTGLYVEYGLTNLKEKNGTLPLVTYSSDGLNGVKANSVLNMSNAGELTSLSFGLQVRISFGISKTTKPAAEPSIQKEPQQPSNTSISDDETEVIQRPIVFGILGESVIPEVQKPHLDEVADIMRQHPDIHISIVGHTCNNGTELEDPKVGAARAQAVARYLQAKGIDRKRMDVTSASESDQGDANDSGANYQSRRVNITLE